MGMKDYDPELLERAARACYDVINAIDEWSGEEPLPLWSRIMEDAIAALVKDIPSGMRAGPNAGLDAVIVSIVTRAVLGLK